MKRAFDLLLAVALLPVALVVCLVAAIPVALECRASPFFLQRRLGRDERPFWLLKLRSMHIATPDRASHEVGQDMILRSGRLLRRLKVDELPQLWNVLTGAMSFVGPRPGLPSQVELTAARRALGVFDLMPGITGPAQIRGIDMSTPARLAEVDSSYAGPWSLRRDLSIIWATATGSGSGDAATLRPPVQQSLDSMPASITTGGERRYIIVTGANGTLGQAVLQAIGPDRAIAVTRGDAAPIAGFKHERLGLDATIAPATLAAAVAIINAAGRVTGNAADLAAANVDLAANLARQARAAGIGKFVQVGSFSVYGHAEIIGTATPIAPTTDYGRSKALADQALLDLMTTDFAVESIRLPFLFSEQQPALLGRLIGLGRQLRVLPGSRPPMLRSMITYDDAARLMVEAASDDRRGVTHAADPLPFDYALLCRLVEAERGQRWRILAVPVPVAAAIHRLAPGIGRRLFRSSVLMPDANRAGAAPLGLEAALRGIIRTMI